MTRQSDLLHSSGETAARSTAEIEHGGARWGMDEAKNLLGFAYGDLAGAKLREEKALQPLPECVILKPGPRAHIAMTCSLGKAIGAAL